MISDWQVRVMKGMVAADEQKAADEEIVALSEEDARTMQGVGFLVRPGQPMSRGAIRRNLDEVQYILDDDDEDDWLGK